MSDSDDQTKGRGSRWPSRLAVAGLVGVVAAVAANQIVMPAIARWTFSKTPAKSIANIQEGRKKLTKRVVTSFMAGMIGPAEPVPTTEYPKPEQVDAPEPSTSGGASSKSKPAKSNSAESTSHRPTKAPKKEASGGRRDGKGPPKAEKTSHAAVPKETPTFRVSRREINRRLKDPGEVSRKIAVVSNPDGSGSYRGLRVLKVAGWYGNFGLRRGDVVLAVNGRKMTTRQRAISQIAAMKQRTRFVLDVQRGDETFQIVYRIPHPKKQGSEADGEEDSNDDG